MKVLVSPQALVISPHALDRGYERFDAEPMGVSTIRREVAAGCAAGRVSSLKPPRFVSDPSRRGFYCWSEDGRRAFVLRATGRGLEVVTVLYAKSKAAA